MAPPTHVALRPRLPMAPGWFWDGSVRFAWSLPRTIKSHFALRPQLPPAPGWFRNGSVRFGWSLSMALPTHAAPHRWLPMRLAHGIHLLRVAPEWLRVLRLRSLLISGVAITLGPVHGIADARVVPRRSGPKRLGCKHCRVALTTPSPHPGLRSCSSPPAGEVSFHTRRQSARTLHAGRPGSHVRSRPPSSCTTCAHREWRDCASAARPPPSRAANSSELRCDSTLAMRRANWLRVSPAALHGKRWSRP